MAVAVLLLIISFCCYDTQARNLNDKSNAGSASSKLLPLSFPSKEDTLAYVDALKHSNFSQWRSLEEVAKRAGGGSCTGAINTSVLTALYLLGLFNLCAASPASCCVPSLAEDKRRRRSLKAKTIEEAPYLSPYALPPLLNSLTQNISTFSLEEFKELPQVASPDGGKVPVHISVVEQVRKLWDSNPRLLSNLPCTSATEAVRSSFISLSGVASGIILAYSIAQLNHCYPDHQNENGEMNKIWFFPIPKDTVERPKTYIVKSLPSDVPVEGEDQRNDDCARASVPMADGSCERLLSSRVCPYMQWVLLNVETRQGECVPRLCGDGKIFVEGDQLCHDVNEPGLCPENQRLYLTAWGEAVCDCMDGMFFGPDKKCHRIYEQGNCYKGSVLQFYKPSKTLVCQTDQCKGVNDRLPLYELPYVISEDNTCYQFGSPGPCEGSDQFGFNIEDLEPSCVSLEEAGLLRPQISYQYSHMTFPSFTNTGFPHFEVSYMILNGSTWELVMRTVGRQKRDTREEFDDEREETIPFIDTREFPKSMEEAVSKFDEFKIGLVNKDMNIWNKEAMTNKTRAENIRNLIGEKEIDLEFMPKFIPFAEAGNVSLLYEFQKRKNGLEKGTDEELSAFDSNKSKINDTGLYYNINASVSNGKNVHLTANEKSKDVMVKVLKGNSNPCKWHILFYSQMPNASVSYNSTSINILSHPHFSKLFFYNKTSEDESFQAFENPSNSPQKTKLINTENKYQAHENSTPMSMRGLNHFTSQQNIKDFDNKTSESEILVRQTILGSSSSNFELKSKNETFVHFNDTSKLRKMYKQDETLNKSDEIYESTSGYHINLEPNTDLKQAKNRSKTAERENKKNVSQHNLKSEKQRSKNIGKRNKYRKRKNEREKKGRNKKRKQRLRKKKKKRIFKNKKQSSGKVNLEAEKRTRKSKSKKSRSRKDSVKRNQFQNQSLPDYLRNRGRRQAGTKKRSKLSHGIINAPLLNQCRPGAKRDYNGYCRSKVIPAEKNSVIRRHAKTKYYQSTTPPRMNCKEGKRLDSRGVCRETYSGLG